MKGVEGVDTLDTLHLFAIIFTQNDKFSRFFQFQEVWGEGYRAYFNECTKSNFLRY